ncbi:hypothetical protein A3H10_01400 [Candidatus Uhrbacteria bacterium RIFCSPLOWO2_12_FULL_46_10]|nr:MAG: hypothetical protein A3H10_01400 [Candidatus Uhrbacteria bacterium RIFCSPLOWO2_12_FULL_46_10]
MPRYRRHNFFLLALLPAIFLWPLLTSALNIPAPDPVIKIPGLSDLSQIEEKPCPDLEKKIGASGCLYIPWIGEYVGGLYKFAVLASTILATVVIMAAGFIWLTAGGNVSQIGTARSYIGGAIMGLVLMLGSYTILNLINPDLVVFNALRIPVIKKVPILDFAQQVYDSGQAIGLCVANGRLFPPLNNTDLDPALQQNFNDAGAAAKIDPAFVAAISAWESRGCFNSTTGACANRALISPKGAAGIAQIIPKTAADIWDKYATDQFARPKDCAGDDDPRNGTYTPTCAKWMNAHDREVIFMSAAYASKYVSPQLARCGFGVRLDMVAAGYNAGPNGADLCTGVPKAQETKDYIVGTKGFYSKYCSQSGGTLQKPLPPETEQRLNPSDSLPDLLNPMQPFPPDIL